jgi:hypothetical protein
VQRGRSRKRYSRKLSEDNASRLRQSGNRRYDARSGRRGHRHGSGRGRHTIAHRIHQPSPPPVAVHDHDLIEAGNRSLGAARAVLVIANFFGREAGESG